MKTFKEIIKQEPLYINDWSDSKEKGVFEDFEISDERINILFASYSCSVCEGDAWVLFELDGKLYEVNGGHCSCYGLEGQWEPDEVDLKELEHRLINGTFGEYEGNTFKDALCTFLGVVLKN